MRLRSAFSKPGLELWHQLCSCFIFPTLHLCGEGVSLVWRRTLPTNNRPVRSRRRRGDYGKPLARECEGFQKRESGASSYVCRQHGTAPKVSWAPNSFLETFFGHPIKLIGSSERRKRGKADTSHRAYRPHERHLTFDKLFPGNTLTGYRERPADGAEQFPFLPPIVNSAEKKSYGLVTGSRNRKRIISPPPPAPRPRRTRPPSSLLYFGGDRQLHEFFRDRR